MVNDFLRKYQEELISDKIQLKEDIDLLDTKIKEETKFLALLENTNDSYFSDFSPRDLNVKNNEKAAEVRKNINDLSIQYQDLLNSMKFYDSRLGEVNALILNSNKKVTNSSESDSSIIEEENVTKNKMDEDNDLKSNLLDIQKVILLDPYRASMMINSIIDRL